MKHLPIALVYSRLLISAIIIFLAFRDNIFANHIIFVLMLIGLLTDIFDGIIARKLGVSTIKLRELDTKVDRVFWFSILLSLSILEPEAIKNQLTPITILILFEASVYGLSIIRFRKIPSPHNLISKLWGLMVFFAFSEVLLTSSAAIIFDSMIIVGIVSRIDSFLIYSILKKWDHDIPSFHHAIKIRKGEAIKTHSLFNG
ncbi:MAG: CDP-alcohol phosphatidyltransferase family protein [bacterium]|nr:CDP-alcohol phosphatidyltransferase family protein [bacterium]